MLEDPLENDTMGALRNRSHARCVKLLISSHLAVGRADESKRTDLEMTWVVSCGIMLQGADGKGRLCCVCLGL